MRRLGRGDGQGRHAVIVVCDGGPAPALSSCFASNVSRSGWKPLVWRRCINGARSGVLAQAADRTLSTLAARFGSLQMRRETTRGPSRAPGSCQYDRGPAYQRVAGGGPLPTGGRYCGRSSVHRQDLAGGVLDRDLGGRVAQGVEQLELGPVVVGDRGEVLVEGDVQELEGVDRFLRPVDQDQDVAEAGGLLEALVVAVEGDDAGAQGAIGLDDPRPPPTGGCAWASVTSAATRSWVRKSSTMACDSSPRCSLIRARLPIPKSVELPHELKADVDAAGPLVEAAVGAEAEDPGLDDTCRRPGSR